MINQSWRCFKQKRFEVVLIAKMGFYFGFESGRRNIINNDFAKDREIHPRDEDLHPRMSRERYKSLALGWTSLFLYKVVVGSYFEAKIGIIRDSLF